MIVRIESLEKNYGSQRVLDIEHQVFEPGLTCVMGRNGCGKTTLLNILTGLLPYDSGRVSYDGKPYSKTLAGELTLVQQKPMLFQRTVEENIAFPLKVRGYSRIDIPNRVSAMLSELDIHDLRYKKGHELSGGECQKVAIARALIFKPSLLMLDEPTSNIDRHSREMIEMAVRHHSSSGRTVIWVTHDMQQAEQLGERIVELPTID